jgi:hypothetical protein
MGFKNVHKHREKFMARIKENGQLRHLGMFATPEEAALRYARHVGPVRAAAEAAAARGEGPKWPLRGKGPPQITTAEEILAATAAEGLELVPSSTNETGFKNVWKNDDGKYASHVRENGKLHYLGIFATPEEAALCYARHIGAERAAAEAAAARGEGPQSLTADEARAAAAAEGLELVPSSSNETGFKGAHKRGGKYEACIREDGKQRYLGRFATPEEAALCYARHIGAERAAAEAAEARGEGLEPLKVDEARAVAAAKGLELVSSSSETYEHPPRLEAWPARTQSAPASSSSTIRLGSPYSRDDPPSPSPLASSSSTTRKRESKRNCSGLQNIFPIGKRQAIREFNAWIQATAAVGGVVLQGRGAHVDWWQARSANQEEWQDAPGGGLPQPRQHVQFQPLLDRSYP